MFYSYVIISQKHKKRLYIGISDNPYRRLQEHNAGETKTTKAYRPYKIVLTEQHLNRKVAREREKWLKSGCGREWIKLNFLGQ
jgi:putative endonuclease